MDHRSTSKRIHFASTAWFALSVGYVLIWTLRKAGNSWWTIVSLSGYSAVIGFLLISLYLFAIFRGVSRSQKSEIEHPVTASVYYHAFYDASSFIGAVVGALSAAGTTKLTHYLLVIAVGSLWTTFLVWVIVDPILGLAEMLLPASRQHRHRRMAQAKDRRKTELASKQHLLEDLQADVENARLRRRQNLQSSAERLAGLIASGETINTQAETEAVDIGLDAWRMGGIDCMRQLHDMVMDRCGGICREEKVIDYISIWWDGIGSWQNHGLETKVA